MIIPVINPPLRDIKGVIRFSVSTNQDAIHLLSFPVSGISLRIADVINQDVRFRPIKPKLRSHLFTDRNIHPSSNKIRKFELFTLSISFFTLHSKNIKINKLIIFVET